MMHNIEELLDDLEALDSDLVDASGLVGAMKKALIPLTCGWELFDTDTNAYDTQCGNAFLVSTGTPKQNEMNFCCYCGLKIKTVEPSADT